MPTLRFINPAIPKSRAAPPQGPEWRHEIKFDGFRVQLHRIGRQTQLFSRNGHPLPRRFQFLRHELISLPVRSCVLDGELMCSDQDGRPNFKALISGSTTALCVWCFDLLQLNGQDLRSLGLSHRRTHLTRLLSSANSPVLRFSQDFPDPIALLRAAEEMQLEGIVSKQGSLPYRPGRGSGWIKVKTKSWRQQNSNRAQFFLKSPHPPR